MHMSSIACGLRIRPRSARNVHAGHGGARRDFGQGAAGRLLPAGDYRVYADIVIENVIAAHRCVDIGPVHRTIRLATRSGRAMPTWRSEIRGVVSR